jgi:hypothetical protein
MGRFNVGRIRVPLALAGAVVLLLSIFTTLLPEWIGLIVFAVALAPYLRLGGPRERAAVPLAVPVTGRWRALNSPASRVPSHGLHAYGQTFAIDLVHEPAPGSRQTGGWWPPAKRPERFPGFGADVRAPADGVVVGVHDRERDHWSRTGWLALPFLLAEGALRELTGPGRILGNHVVLDLGGGVYAELAHLQRRSVRVRPGDAVRAGTVIARCGNSGNSSEPHLHLQVMDHPHAVFADGIPFTFAGAGLPRNGEVFVTSAA